jgi:hypothetical protein
MPHADVHDIHPIFGADWFHEREVDIGPLAARGSFWTEGWQRVSFDVSDQVIEVGGVRRCERWAPAEARRRRGGLLRGRTAASRGGVRRPCATAAAGGDVHAGVAATPRLGEDTSDFVATMRR